MAVRLDTFSLVSSLYARLNVLVLALGISSFAAAPAHADLLSCEALKKAWSSISSDASYDEKASLYDQAYNDSDCDGVTVDAFGADIIHSRLDSVVPFDSLASHSGNIEELKETLLDLQEFGEHWRLSYFLGEIYRQQQQVLPALRAYQEALGLVDDEELTPNEPDHRMIARLRDRLDELAVVGAQVSNSPEDVQIPTTRSGQTISQYSFSTRGYKRKKTLVPIQFKYDQAILTEAGRLSFQDVRKTLEAQGNPDIRVVGHTDPAGSDPYNLDLSLRRAQAIREALLNTGYSGRIDVDGKGEAQPFRFDDPSLYSEDLRNQAHRRVEFVRN
ncbi:OmpA family protein [uncultured Roseibium sp.]|uniref:OmpA family protein n=1 Tax=uncultured Roseibium sp. TaxID=1936171 RepID=UPI00260B5432|nr:OmpA family protein [uncultured Roseibium sp.]